MQEDSKRASTVSYGVVPTVQTTVTKEPFYVLAQRKPWARQDSGIAVNRDRFKFDPTLDASLSLSPDVTIACFEAQALRPGLEIAGLGFANEHGEVVWIGFSSFGSSGSVVTTPEEAARLTLLCYNSTGQSPNVQIHTHPAMTAFWSSTDLGGQFSSVDGPMDTVSTGDMFFIVYSAHTEGFGIKYGLTRRVSWSDNIAVYNDGPLYVCGNRIQAGLQQTSTATSSPPTKSSYSGYATGGKTQATTSYATEAAASNGTFLAKHSSGQKKTEATRVSGGGSPGGSTVTASGGTTTSEYDIHEKRIRAFLNGKMELDDTLEPLLVAYVASNSLTSVDLHDFVDAVYRITEDEVDCDALLQIVNGNSERKYADIVNHIAGITISGALMQIFSVDAQASTEVDWLLHSVLELYSGNREALWRLISRSKVDVNLLYSELEVVNPEIAKILYPTRFGKARLRLVHSVAEAILEENDPAGLDYWIAEVGKYNGWYGISVALAVMAEDATLGGYLLDGITKKTGKNDFPEKAARTAIDAINRRDFHGVYSALAKLSAENVYALLVHVGRSENSGKWGDAGKLFGVIGKDKSLVMQVVLDLYYSKFEAKTKTRHTSLVEWLRTSAVYQIVKEMEVFFGVSIT